MLALKEELPQVKTRKTFPHYILLQFPFTLQFDGSVLSGLVLLSGDSFLVIYKAFFHAPNTARIGVVRAGAGDLGVDIIN